MRLTNLEFRAILGMLKASKGLTHRAAYSIVSAQMWSVNQSLELMKCGIAEGEFEELVEVAIIMAGTVEKKIEMGEKGA